MKMLNKLATSVLLALMLATLTLFGAVGGVHAQSRSSGCGTWNVVPSPNPGLQNVFDGVTAIAANDVWAVGYNEIGPLTAHWDGTSWTAIANPILLGTNSLFAVTAVSTSNVWAVGQSGSQVLTEQWDGTSWNVVTAPTPANSTSSIFVSTAAIPGTNDVWAAGNYTTSQGVSKTLIEEWDGSSWNIIPSPNVGGKGNALLGIAAASATEAWAVGTYKLKGGGRLELIEKWNGTSWSVVTGADVSNADVLWAVTQIPGNDQFWAAGTSQQTKAPQHTLVERENGASWSAVHSQNVSGINNTLYGVAALTSSDAWAVGLLYKNSGANQSLIEHWNGSSWSVYYSPNPNGNSILTGVTGVPSTKTAWAVGVSYDGTGNSYTVTEEVCP